jgi:LPS-assembly lipoprotein
MKYVAVFCLILITACGFTPVYGTKTVSNDLSNIDIVIIPDEDGQIVRNHLIDVMYNDGYPSNPQLRLVVSPVQESILEIGIDRDDEASRAQLRQETTMRLVNPDDKVLLQRTVRATSGYNILAGQFTTFVTEEDARKQALKALSNNIITQLELYFNR